MSETTRTGAYVAAAVVAVGVAAGAYYTSQPADLAEFSDVGSEFYPDFDDPLEATGLEVAAYDAEAAQTDVFKVEQRDGRWRIPSHYNYPADGEEQLAKTAASVVGIDRKALASTDPSDFQTLGVLDPLDDSVTGTEGRGDRVRLLKGDTVLADYIIGNQYEDGGENAYYVRRPDEDRVYIAEVNIDVSTRFRDWIEPDLLDVSRSNVRLLVLNTYSIDPQSFRVDQGEVSILQRESATADWELEERPADKKVKTSTINSMLTAIDDLRIVDVRPKPAGLSAELKAPGGGGGIELGDLERRGFFLDQRGGLLSSEGEVQVGTESGVVYRMLFGEAFTPRDLELKSGGNAAEGDEQAGSEEENADGSEVAAEEDEEQSRYVFIMARFAENLLGDPPLKPEPPAEVQEPNESEDGEESADADGAEADGDASNETGDEDSTADAEAEQPDPQKEYEQKLAAYEQALKEFEGRAEEGRKKAKELNERFADWYYVISADVFDDLHVTRDELLEPAEPETPETPANPGPQPDTPDAPAPADAESAPADDPPAEPPADVTTPESSETPAEVTEEPASS